MEHENQFRNPDVNKPPQNEHHEFAGASSLMELAVLSVIILATLMSGFGMSLLLGTLI